MSRRHAVIKNGRVVNVVVWDGVAKWQPPAGTIAVQHDSCDIGDKWDYDKQELTKPCRIHKCNKPDHVQGEPCVAKEAESV